MAIKISSLKPDSLKERSLKRDYLYKDLQLDLQPTVYLNRQLNKREALKDVSAIYNIEAVKNSIVTAFLTAPGDKILNPTYGIDLRKYLFESVDDFTADIIQDEIFTMLPVMEPRIELETVEVTPDEDNNTYSIDIQINVPSLNVTGVSIKSELNSSGYTIL